MRQHFAVAFKVLLLCLPQLALSAVGITFFVRVFKLPDQLIALHLMTILAGQAVFFWFWGLWARRDRIAHRRWFPIAYAAALFIKALGINLLYLGSYLANTLWGSYISWHNLSATLPHLQGFYLAFGLTSILTVAAAFVLLAAYFFVLYRKRVALVRGLRWTLPGHVPAYTAAGLALALTGLAALLWYVNIDPHRALRQDPVFAFWTNRTEAKPLMTPAMLVDLAAARSYRLPEVFRRRNVIIITIDCMRSDHLSFRGYKRETMPYLAGLAGSGYLHAVEFSTSNGNDSPQGILALLGSQYPHRHNLYNFKLPDLLKRAGYRTHIIAAGDHTTRGELRKFYGSSIDFFSDGLTPRAYTINDDRGAVEAVAQLPPADGQPAFFLIHLMSPHNLGTKEVEFARWQPALLQLDWGRMIFGGVSPEVMTNTYDNGLLQADHYLRQVMELLRQKGYLQDYTGVITGDHGEGMGERGHFGHTRYLFMEDIKIPILFFDSEPVDYGPMPFGSLVDVAPTLADRLDLPVPARWQGQSLFRKPGSDVIFAVGKREGEWRAVLTRQNGAVHKYLFYGNKPDNFRELLFDIGQDPGERHDLVASEPERLQAMRQRAEQEFRISLPLAEKLRP